MRHAILAALTAAFLAGGCARAGFLGAADGGGGADRSEPPGDDARLEASPLDQRAGDRLAGDLPRGPRLALLAGSPQGPESSKPVVPLGIVEGPNGAVYFGDAAAHLVRVLDAAGNITTLAGSGIGHYHEGNGTAAAFERPRWLEPGPDGALYLVDEGANVVSRVALDGTTTLHAGVPYVWVDKPGPVATATFHGLGGIVWASTALVVDSRWAGKLYKVTGGQVTWFSGAGAGATDGPAATARFSELGQLGIDGAGHIYAAEPQAHRIRHIAPDGSVSTIGSGTRGFVDAPVAQACFNFPTGVAVTSAGTVYVADSHNDRIRKITGGQVTTLAGGLPGSSDGTGAAARFLYPFSLRLLQGGELLVAEVGNGAIRRVTPTGVVTTLVATPVIDGVGTSARFRTPAHGVRSANGDLLVADTLSHRVRRVSLAGVVTTVAGDGHSEWSGGGAAKAVALDEPFGVAESPAGDLYVATVQAKAIVKITASGVASVLAGGSCCSADGQGAAAQFDRVTDIVYASGDLYVTDRHRIRRVSLGGLVTTIAGSTVDGLVDGAGSVARFSNVVGLAVEPGGTLVVADQSNHAIRRVTLAGQVSTLASGLGHVNGALKDARFRHPAGIAAAADGTLYVADSWNHAIRALGTDGQVRTIVGDGTPGLVDGPLAGARLRTPIGVISLDSKTLAVIELDNHVVRLLHLE